MSGFSEYYSRSGARDINSQLATLLDADPLAARSTLKYGGSVHLESFAWSTSFSNLWFRSHAAARSSSATVDLSDSIGDTSSNPGLNTIPYSERTGSYISRVLQPVVDTPPSATETTAMAPLTQQAALVVAIDPGNTLTTAYNLGSLSGTQTLNEFVGNTDPNDYFRFTLDSISGFNLNLTNLTADADLQLLSSTGNVIASSISSGTTPEAISRTLSPGTYYIRVYQYSGDTNYSLSLSATATSQAAIYSTNFGYGLVDAAAAVAQSINQPDFAAVPNSGGINWGLDLINAPEVWARGYTGQGVTVAVVDSGVDYGHADLRNNIWVNTREIPGNGIDDDHNGYVDDVLGWDFVDNDNSPTDLDGHGTHIAGTIAAANDGVGTTGVAYGARIMPVRVLDANGFGTYANIALGVRYAADNGAQVINLSLGGSSSSPDVVSAIQYATQKGAVVVTSAGNEAGAQPTFPANLANQWGIAVGAVDSTGKMASFSNKAGASVLNYVASPGVSVYSTTPNNTYQYYSGTSMAAPYVAGAAALILSANPTLTPAQVVNLLVGTARSNAVTV